MVFAPCLWNAPKRPERVKQVWFEGAHSDVGGGYPKTGLSDTTLLWMVSEASRQGLVFDKPLLDTYVNSRSEAERHNSLTWFYKVSNLRERMRPRPESERVLFTGTHRNLDSPGCGVMVASSARGHFAGENSSYRPANLEGYVDRRSSGELDTRHRGRHPAARVVAGRHRRAARHARRPPRSGLTPRRGASCRPGIAIR